MISGHRSTRPGTTRLLAHLGLTPVIDLNLRLGEGTGAVLAFHIVDAAARILGQMGRRRSQHQREGRRLMGDFLRVRSACSRACPSALGGMMMMSCRATPWPPTRWSAH